MVMLVPRTHLPGPMPPCSERARATGSTVSGGLGMSEVPYAWIEFGATLIYDLHRAGILYQIDEMTDEEIDKALEKVRGTSYNRSLSQTSRVAPEKPSSNVGLVSALT